MAFIFILLLSNFDRFDYFSLVVLYVCLGGSKKKKYVREVVGGDTAENVFKMKKMRDSHGNLIEKKAGELYVELIVDMFSFQHALSNDYTTTIFPQISLHK